MARLPEDRITALLVDQRDHLWVGYERAGLLAIEPDTNRIRRLALADGQTAFAVRRLAVDRSALAAERRLWLATQDHGLQTLSLRSLQAEDGSRRASTLTQVPVDHLGLQAEDISALASARSGALWLGLRDGTLAYYDHSANDWQLHTPMNASAIHALLETRDGTLWVGTEQDGLWQLPHQRSLEDPSALRHYTRKNGLASNHIAAMLEDDQGVLWLAGNRGLTRFDPNGVQAQRFSRNDGLRDEVFLRGVALHARSGELLFASASSLVSFYPSRLVQAPKPPRLNLSAWSRNRFLAQQGSGFNAKVQPDLRP